MYKIYLTLSRVLLGLCFVLCAIGAANAQTTFTYSGAGGNWNGVTWTKSGTATSDVYPGQSSGLNHTVVLTVTSGSMNLNVSPTNGSIKSVSLTGPGTLALGSNSPHGGR